MHLYDLFELAHFVGDVAGKVDVESHVDFHDCLECLCQKPSIVIIVVLASDLNTISRSSHMASLRVIKRSDLRKFIDLALLLHFSSLQNIVNAERKRHKLINCLTKLCRLADRKKTELMKILE